MKFKIGDILDLDNDPTIRILDIFFDGKYNNYKVQELRSKSTRNVPCRFIEEHFTLNPQSGPPQLNPDLLKLIKKETK